MDLESWVAGGSPGGRVLIIRHDVDQHPATALRMASIEARHGVRGTWYFRWRTASPYVIARVLETGGGVGLHYESLTRLVLQRGLSSNEIDAALISEARADLRREVAAFRQHFGPLQSFCAHGDTRVPGVSNQVLLRGEQATQFGVQFDANEALAGRRLGLWMTDRSTAEGRWKERLDPMAVLQECQEPVLCLTHPNNWCSGVSLWSDRAKSRLLPKPSPSRRVHRISLRTGSDSPTWDALLRRPPGPLVPSPQLQLSPVVRSFGPVAVSLRREILRYYYDRREHLTSETELRTLETNSGLAEVRAATLERLLERAQVQSLRDRDVLDLGCGFGSLALVFAARGARVTAVDPNGSRLQVGASVAEQHGLGVRWITGSMDSIELGAARFDVIIMNNSFCYVVARTRRRQSLARALALLRPGGLLLLRNPNRIRWRDQFTSLPLVALLPPRMARVSSRICGRERSDVRLLTPAAARRELRRAGFVGVESAPPFGRSRLWTPFAAYQHVFARRPGK